MEFPEKIKIQFVTKENIPISNLIVQITILANKKNDYSMGFFKTHGDGTITIFKSAVEKRIDQAMSDFIMDYSSDINDCKDSMNIVVENLTELKTRLKNIEKFYPESANELSQLIVDCSNDLYKSANDKHKIATIRKIVVNSI